ncbi:MAG: ATP-binding cassette domain-containing protein [Microthrixaceae bacterium]|nr:ATP-binding cassette domain-containing protein [Microthrixaceae bacterium]
MTQLLSLLVAGAVSGGLYAIMASGLVLTYQASGVFNVGHGAVAFVTALVYFQLNQPTAAGGLGLPMLPAAVTAILVVAPLLGFVLDLVLFRRLARAPIAARLVGTVGVLIALPAASFLLIDAINVAFGTEMPDVDGDAGVSPPGIGPSPARSWTIAKGISVNSDQLAIVAVAAVAAGGLWFLMRHTRLGLETRAGVDRAVLARLRGIDTDRSSRIVWALSTLLAGCAGVLIAPLFDLSALTFHMIVFTSFTAAVAARLVSVPIAFAAGIALGAVQNLVYGYSPELLAEISGFRASVPFMLLFVLLFFVQGRGSRSAGSVAEDAPPSHGSVAASPWRRRVPWILGAAGLVAYGVFVADGYWTGVVNRGLVLGLIFLSFVVLTGIGGMINLAQAAFVTVGGFTAGWLVNHQWPSTIPVLMDNGRLTFWPALVVAVVVAAAVGVLVALPSLRLGGLTLALATLALAFIGDRLIFQLEGVRNGSRGWSLPRPTLGPIDLGDEQTLFLVLFAVVLGCIWLVGNLNRSATGRALLAMRSSEVAAATSGIDPLRSKLVLFAVSAGLAGFAGAWFALVNSPITNVSAPPLLGLVWLAVAVTFGIRRPGGAVVAGLVYAALPVVLYGIGTDWDAPWSLLPDGVRELIAEPHLASMLFGLGAITLAREPDGVLAAFGSGGAGRRPDKAQSRPSAEHNDVVAEGTPSGALLSLSSVRAGYGEVAVLHDIDLAVGRGQVVAVLGANGAGKSTLCGLIAGTLTPSSGSVHFDGADVTAVPPHIRARAGIVLAPEARGIFPGLSVDDNLAIRLRSDEQREAARKRFPILAERRAQKADLLSGGEQQQLAMAAVLPDPPKLFIADEPSLGLSPMAADTLFDAMAELKELGTTLILVEEQAGRALEMADQVVLVDLGRIVWSGPASEFDTERLGAAYLGG